MEYSEFLKQKEMQVKKQKPLKFKDLNKNLFDYQRSIVDFHCTRGGGASFLDTGMGKSIVALEYQRIAIEQYNKPSLMIAPLAVGPQHVKESNKFDVCDAEYLRNPLSDYKKKIYITNYENIHKFNADDFCVYSPPYSSLYIYSESIADMGNVDSDDQFEQQYQFLVNDLFRVTRPGRLHAVHVKDLVFYMNASEDGTSGLRPFSDTITKVYQRAGFNFHSRITIYRDPVAEMYKSKPQGLLWKSFREDASICRVGMPEYLMVYKKWDKESTLQKPVLHPKERVPLEQWQNLASPIWKTSGNVWNLKDPGNGDGDLPATNVLNTKAARDEKAERHLCPMPMNITKRACDLWTNEGDIVYSPFAGVGSEGVAALARKRKFIGCELHPAYYNQAIKNLNDENSISETVEMFDFLESKGTGF